MYVESGPQPPKVANESDIIPVLEEIAKLKDLEVFIFKGEELKEYFSNISPELGVALLASNEDNAKWNLKNLRNCYLIKLGA